MKKERPGPINKLAVWCLKNPKVMKKITLKNQHKKSQGHEKNSKKIQRDFSSAYAEAG